MIASWNQGRATVDDLIARGLLERVVPDLYTANYLLEQAQKHLGSSRIALPDDPTGSFQLAYEASRKSLAALLSVQGLRATSKGGHRAVEDALRAQLVPPMSTDISNFGWMRKVRNATAYPNFEKSPVANIEDAKRAQEYAQAHISMSEQLVPTMPPF